MTATHYSPTDALTYIREALDVDLDWIHNALAETYGVDTIDGEDYLPGILNDVMSLLYAVHRETTDACVKVGAYRRESGHLHRPHTYSNGIPVYTAEVDLNSRRLLTERLNHPSDDPSTPDYMPARRAGLHVVKDGADCA